MALFTNKQEANLRSCIRMVEDALQSLGHPPDESRTESADDMPAWRVENGGAPVDVRLGIEEEKNVLHVTATVGLVPDRANEVALFTKRLELTAGELGGLASGLRGREVVLVVDRSAAALAPSEVEALLRHIKAVAGHYAGLLVGGVMVSGGITNRA